MVYPWPFVEKNCMDFVYLPFTLSGGLAEWLKISPWIRLQGFVFQLHHLPAVQPCTIYLTPCACPQLHNVDNNGTCLFWLLSRWKEIPYVKYLGSTWCMVNTEWYLLQTHQSNHRSCRARLWGQSLDKSRDQIRQSRDLSSNPNQPTSKF